MLTPMVVAVAQGSKIIRVGTGQLRYDADRFLVITGETDIDASVVDASPERPYLAVGIELPPLVVARVLAALASFDTAPPVEDPPAAAFLAAANHSMISAIARFLAALNDDLERSVLAPLALEEVVFRVMQSSGAAGCERRCRVATWPRSKRRSNSCASGCAIR